MHNAKISLDGMWDFMHVADDRLAKPVEVRKIAVPSPWQAQFADLRMRGGTGIYSRHVTVPAGWINDRVFLRFGAVFHNTRAWVNGELVGVNEGGFLPFAFDVTNHLVEGRNEIKVSAESPTDDAEEFPDSPLAEIPFGKQSWYGPLSGIWQSVYLERRILDHITRMRINPELATGRVEILAVLHQSLFDQTEVEIRVFDPGENCVASKTWQAGAGHREVSTDLVAPHVRAWSPDHPDLYRLEMTFTREGHVIEKRTETFGFRTIETRDGKLFLNGEPLYLRAALDQDYYPETVCTMPSTAFVEDQFRKAKELGLNCLRCHIKAADPRYYQIADRLGLLIWTELPNGGLSTLRSRSRKEHLMRGIVDRDGNHPSIIIWTIINENWGVDLVHDPDHRAWLRRTYHWLKSYDRTRLVVDNSPLAPSFHVETDLADYHYYAAYPDGRLQWDTFAEQLAGRPAWLFSQEGDAVIKGDEPLLCSEFGNWGLPDPAMLRSDDGHEPWWFETGHDWGEGIMYAHGVENRFSDWSLDRVFGSLQNFVTAAQWQQYRALKYQIEVIRSKPQISGYVITELTDAHWECNGLFDMRRNKRVFHDVFASINADIIIVPRWTKLSYWADEPASFELSVANGSASDLAGCSLIAILGGEQRIELPVVKAGHVHAVGALKMLVPDVQQHTSTEARFELRDTAGAVLATNTLDLALHPDRHCPDGAAGLVWSPEARIRDRLAALGYQIGNSITDANLVVAASHDGELASYVRAGGRALLLPEQEGTLTPFFPHWQGVKVSNREGTVWRGDWASAFAWLRRSGLFRRMPGGPLLDESYDRVFPTKVISGTNLIDFQARVHAGLAVGWVHKPVALAVERGYGSGRVLVSTFRLFENEPGEDPTATTLLDLFVAQTLGLAGAVRTEAAAT